MTALGTRPPDWTRDAACLGMATRGRDPWHPEGDDGERNAQYAVARRVCRDCPVRLPCARYGIALLAVGQASGMFGGLRPDELRRVAPAACTGRPASRPDAPPAPTMWPGAAASPAPARTPRTPRTSTAAASAVAAETAVVA